MLQFQLAHPIDFYPYPKSDGSLFSILIPSWRNFEHLRLLIESIRKNSTYTHQICVHLNEGDDQSKNLMENLKISHSISQENTGVCFGFNAASVLAECEYVLLIDDDKYVAPEWDKWLYEEIKKQKNHYWCISGTMMERSGEQGKEVIICKNYGISPADFDEAGFLDDYKSYQHADWSGSSWYPLVIDKKIWTLVGGLSTEFSPGMYSDPDFMMKLWQVGVRHYIGLEKSRCYHFMSKSTSRIKKNNGRRQFLLKWKLSNSVFAKHVLKLGQKYLTDGPSNPDLSKMKLKMWTDWMKRKFNFWE